MKIEISNLPSIQVDNDIEYIDFISDAIKHSDPSAYVVIAKNSYGVTIMVTPSNKGFKQHIIENLLEANRRLGILIHFSKSLKAQKIVSYYIDKD